MTSASVATRMTRPRHAALGGVCAGLADHLGWRLGRVRLMMILLALCGGAGIALYLWLWALTPVADSGSEQPTGVRRTVPVAIVLLLLALISAVVASSLESYEQPNGGIPLVIVFCLAAVAWSIVFDRADPGRSHRGSLIARSVSAGILLVAGTALLFSSGGRPRATTAVGAIVMIVLGVGVIASPFIVRFWGSRMGERAARVRESERAEIAAHLHDSVLQTLALIQNRAGASSEVARLARAQERELRDWLFAGTIPAGDDLATELRDAAALIELDYAARIDVVVVGDPIGPNAAILAAAREGMVNAARHVGGEVSVYLESARSTVDVYIRDRGPGFDVDALPPDRLGVRESIIGRMSRAGGTATVGNGVGGIGTEIRLHLDTKAIHG